MFGTTPGDEWLGRPPFRLPRMRRAALARSSVAAALLVLAALVLLAGSPSPPAVPVSCRPEAPRPTPRPVPPPGTVGVPVPVGTGDTAQVVAAGDRVDILAATPGPEAAVIAENVLVLAVPTGGEGPDGGSMLYVAAPPVGARRLAGVAPNVRLAITVRPP
jgi:hypothetical protein